MPTPPRTGRHIEALTRVNLRLFLADVKEIQRRALEEGIPWHAKLRSLVRAALSSTRKKELL